MQTDVPDQPQELTFGQEMVGLTFNPSNLPEVDYVKQFFADLIDQAYERRNAPGASFATDEVCTIAIADLVHAQMAAVKIITWKG